MFGARPRRKLKPPSAKKAAPHPPHPPPPPSPQQPIPIEPSQQPRTQQSEPSFPEYLPPQPPRYSTLFPSIPPDTLPRCEIPPPNSPSPPTTDYRHSSSTTLTLRDHYAQQERRTPISTPAPIPETTIDPRQYDRSICHQSPRGNVEQLAQSALCDLISSKLDAVITSIDGEEFNGNEKELEVQESLQSGIRGGWASTSGEFSRGANRAISSAVISTNYFAKAKLYANSKLPPYLPPLKLYMQSYPLLCLAAQYSQRAYDKPAGKEREAFVNADWRMGTKAMVIKSVPIDEMNCVVFAIRGSQTFMDWAVNLNSSPVAPTGFLDDPGNLCHSGFLSVARKMVKPVAARLRALLEEDPTRSTCSLLMTGHSAGGAVASLLYSHMLAEGVSSELNTLTGCFKRLHCFTFGTPPISLLPLNKPSTLRYKKSLFMSFINEGDPVPRADKAYIRSLLNLYASPAPGSTCIAPLPALKPCKRPKPRKALTAPKVTTSSTQSYIWRVPPGTLSNAGSLIVLRENQTNADGPNDDVKAEITSDQELRGVVFGDPVMHMMKVYARRVEVLATKAVTARIWG